MVILWFTLNGKQGNSHAARIRERNTILRRIFTKESTVSVAHFFYANARGFDMCKAFPSMLGINSRGNSMAGCLSKSTVRKMV